MLEAVSEELLAGDPAGNDIGGGLMSPVVATSVQDDELDIL
jgi:hypothetical protein